MATKQLDSAPITMDDPSCWNRRMMSAGPELKNTSHAARTLPTYLPPPHMLLARAILASMASKGQLPESTLASTAREPSFYIPPPLPCLTDNKLCLRIGGGGCSLATEAGREVHPWRMGPKPCTAPTPGKADTRHGSQETGGCTHREWCLRALERLPCVARCPA